MPDPTAVIPLVRAWREKVAAYDQLDKEVDEINNRLGKLGIEVVQAVEKVYREAVVHKLLGDASDNGPDSFVLCMDGQEWLVLRPYNGRERLTMHPISRVEEGK